MYTNSASVSFEVEIMPSNSPPVFDSILDTQQVYLYQSLTVFLPSYSDQDSSDELEFELEIATAKAFSEEKGKDKIVFTPSDVS